MIHFIRFFSAAMLLFILSSCAQLSEDMGIIDTSKPIVYDETVPADKTCTLTPDYSLIINEIDGKNVYWKRKVIIPTGEHKLIVVYSTAYYDKLYTSDDIQTSFKCIAGHDHTMLAGVDKDMRRVSIGYRDDTIVKQQRKMDDERVEANFKAGLPKESAKPTRFEGTWRVPDNSNWGSRSRLVFTGNTWEFYDGNSNVTPEKGLFIVKDDTITLFTLYKQRNGNWNSYNDYHNAIAKHSFVFEVDGGLNLKAIKGFSKLGTFYKEKTK